MVELTGRCIWITGASSGIGRALATTLCDMGNFVIVSSRNKEVLQKLAVSASGRMSALPIDLSAGTDNLANIGAHLNNITDYLDMVICCAGVCEYEDDLSFDPEMYRRVMDVNFIGVIKTLHLAMPLLRKSAHVPHVVAVGSLSSVVPFPRAEAYGASKAALEYFIGALRADTSKLTLKVSLVRPGFVATEMTAVNDFEMPFILKVDDAVKIIIDGIKKRKPVIDFPRRLSWPLRFFGVTGIWCRWIAPRMTRINDGIWKSEGVK
jgi:short-subunit dehydrogenase